MALLKKLFGLSSPAEGEQEKIVIRHRQATETRVQAPEFPAETGGGLTLALAGQVSGSLDLLTRELKQNRILNERLVQTVERMDSHIRFLERELEDLRFSLRRKENLKVVPLLPPARDPAQEKISWFDRVFRPWKMRRRQ